MWKATFSTLQGDAAPLFCLLFHISESFRLLVAPSPRCPHDLRVSTLFRSQPFIDKLLGSSTFDVLVFSLHWTVRLPRGLSTQGLWQMSTLHGSALTLRPTWARLVAGAKQLELRSYSCCARGAVAIMPSGSSCVTGVVRRLGRTQSVLGLQREERIRTIFHGAPCAKLSSVCDFPMLDRLVCTAAAEPRIESCDFFTFGELQQKKHLHRISEDEKKETFSTEFKPSLFTHASCLLIFHLEPGPTNQEDLQKWFPKGAYVGPLLSSLLWKFLAVMDLHLGCERESIRSQCKQQIPSWSETGLKHSRTSN